MCDEAAGNQGEVDQEATDGDDEEEHGASQLHQLRQNINSEQLFKALYPEWEMGLLTSGDAATLLAVHISALTSGVDGSLKAALKVCPQLMQNLRRGGTAELEKRIVTAVDTEIAKIKAEESLEQQSTLMHSFYPLMLAAVAGVPDDTFKNVLNQS